MTDSLVLTDTIDDSVWVLRINRHHRRNALDTATCQALTATLQEAVAAGVRAVVLTGEGSAFCAGADLSGGVYAEGFYSALVELMATIQRSPLVVIGWINGPAVGAGTQLAMSCDLRIVAERAQFRVPVVDVGLALDEVSVAALVSLVGGARARTMLLTGEPVDAAEAVRIGFATAAGDEQVALSWAHRCAAKAPLTVKHLKMEFAQTSHAPFAAEEREAARLAPWSSADAEEARQARAEKRSPRFSGR